MISLNQQQIKDKIYACWIGKNIGGTIGTPYEGSTEFRDVKGFASEKGEPLPNDDLDLQLVFLTAMEQQGPAGLSAAVLAEYWINYIVPHWNEYGTGKSNLKAGILPPLSGELYNDTWKNSNGAWIRSEIWACTAPGFPQIAAQYAFMDACIDHGMSEGTYAEIFTTYLESYAFFGTDIRDMIERALEALPADCRTYQSIRLAIDSFDKGLTLREAREAIVEANKDMGWFQAPGNVAFVVLGLLYGKGDFKQSVLSAVNCGDDTDCTGATVGAFLGILYGTAGIPEDWREYIGDKINSIAVDVSYRSLPKTCAELTERTVAMIPSVLKAHYLDFTWTDGPSDINAVGWEDYYLERIPSPFQNRTKYCYDVPMPPHLKATVCFDREPIVKPFEEITAKIVFKNEFPDPRHGLVTLHLPEGFEGVSYHHHIFLMHECAHHTDGVTTWSVTLKAGEQVQPMNRVIAEINFPGRPMPALIPINIIG